MGLTTVTSILGDVRNTLNDEGSVQRWSDADIVKYYNAAILQLALVRPDATAVTSALTLVSGTRQTLPSGGLRLIRITRNMGADGLTPGVPVKRADEQTLGMFKPDWHTQTAAAAIKNYLYDDRDPKTYWVNPPSDGTGRVQGIYSAAPTAETTVTVAAGALLAVDDVYLAPVKAWMLKEAFGVEISSLASQALSRQYEREFYQSLGIKYQGERAVSPNVPQPISQLSSGGA